MTRTGYQPEDLELPHHRGVQGNQGGSRAHPTYPEANQAASFVNSLNQLFYQASQFKSQGTGQSHRISTLTLEEEETTEILFM